MGAALDGLGRSEEALRYHREAFSVARATGARYSEIDVSINLLWCLMALGRTEEGLAVAESALAVGEYDGSPTLRNNLAAAYMELGRFEEARAMKRSQDVDYDALLDSLNTDDPDGEGHKPEHEAWFDEDAPDEDDQD